MRRVPQEHPEAGHRGGEPEVIGGRFVARTFSTTPILISLLVSPSGALYRSLTSIDSGTISRRNVLTGQLFPKFVRGELEEVAEAHLGEFQPQQAIRGLPLAAAGPEPPQVPVQPLQVQ